MKEVEALSEDRVRLSAGTLYGAIKRLLDDGWIRRVDEPLPNSTRRRRKAYVFTEQGRRLLNAEIERRFLISSGGTLFAFSGSTPDWLTDLSRTQIHADWRR